MSPARETTGLIAQLTRGQHRGGGGGGGATRQASNRPRPLFDGEDSTVTSFQPDGESSQQFDTAADEQTWQEGGGGGESFDGHDDADNVVTVSSDSPSVEAGRGPRGGMAGNGAAGRYGLGHHEVTEEQILSLPDDSLYNLTMTPQDRKLDARKLASTRRAVTGREEATKTSDIVPRKTRVGNNGRRTLSDMHARVNAMSDSSVIIPDAATRSAATRNSRFTRASVASEGHAVPTRFTAGGVLDQGPGPRQTPRRSATAIDASAIANTTVQSFALPDLPNIAELVSGVRKDGTPVFSRTTKARSRFTSASFKHNEAPQYSQIENIALPDEEKAIFTSLHLLKEKVATLELERDEAMQRAETCETEMVALRSQVTMERRLRRPDSGLGSDEERQGSAEWRLRREELQSTVRTAEHQAERAEKKLSNSETVLKRITQERDSLITQLGVAFYSNEELKEENRQLRAQRGDVDEQMNKLEDECAELKQVNQELSDQLVASERSHDSDLRQWAVREAELKARYKQRAVKEKSSTRDTVEEEPARSSNFRRAEPGRLSSGKIMERVEAEVRKARAEAVRFSRRDESRSDREAAKSKSRSRSRARPEATTSKRHSMPAKSGVQAQVRAANRQSRVSAQWFDQLSEADSVVSEPLKPVSATEASTAADAGNEDKDITYLSFLDPNELSALRHKLEQERIESKSGRSSSAPEATAEATQTRKSSMREAHVRAESFSRETRNVRVRSPATADHISYSTPEPQDETEVDASVVSTASKRPTRSRSFEEMTSAFILPDITLRKPAMTEDGPAPAVVPVSEHDVDYTALTIRPAEAPKDALARVIRGLEDEITQRKRELGKVQKQYAALDPAKGKGKRMEVKEQMDRLVAEVEKRSGMVYRLYDVLGGQKMVDEGVVEETLRSLEMEREVLEGSRY